jgi:putative component of membrane protein insertase Oxa1/YidC/SpoIIIJ protein YidD
MIWKEPVKNYSKLYSRIPLDRIRKLREASVSTTSRYSKPTFSEWMFTALCDHINLFGKIIIAFRFLYFMTLHAGGSTDNVFRTL